MPKCMFCSTSSCKPGCMKAVPELQHKVDRQGTVTYLLDKISKNENVKHTSCCSVFFFAQLLIISLLICDIL